MELETWLNDLAAKQPTPGGGAAAALAAATAAALVGMVANYTTGEKWADREAAMHTTAAQAADLQQQALKLMAADAEAFTAVGAAYALPRGTDAEKAARQAAIQAALEAAAEPPSRVASLAATISDQAAELVTQANPLVVSDVAVAASFARTALEGAAVNIAINQRAITDATKYAELGVLLDKIAAAIQRTEAVVEGVQKQLAA